jgi:16S rRNA (cytidine1402-2'-O)-methyltransferase
MNPPRIHDRTDPPDPALPPIAAGLYVVATPIGRLSDLSPRAAELLRRVDVVAAEDTRVTRVLLDHVGAHPRVLLANHAHNEARVSPQIVARIQAGESVALTSDAGTPGISDPGARVVAAVHEAGLPVIPVPGPSALAALLSVAGLPEGPVHFEGFLPSRSAARLDRLRVLARLPASVVLYESPHRIEATVQALGEVLEPDRVVIVGRELTKRFEQVHRSDAGRLAAWMAEDANRARGEFVLAFAGAPAPSDDQAEEDRLAQQATLDDWLRALLEALPPRQAAQIAAQATGLRANALYERSMRLRKPDR